MNNSLEPLRYQSDDGALPAYLLDRKDKAEGKALSTQVKQKRQDKAAKYNVPIPKVRMQSENEVFKEIKSGKRGKSWKRMVTKVTFVPENFTRKPPKSKPYAVCWLLEREPQILSHYLRSAGRLHKL